MNNLSLNSVSQSIFRVNSENGSERDDLIAMGRMLNYEHAVRGKRLLVSALDDKKPLPEAHLSSDQYSRLNEKFQQKHLLYAAKKACEATGASAPENYSEFRKNAINFFQDKAFWNVLRVMYQECITPILPETLAEAVSIFADVVNIGFNETYTITVGSNDIPIFQDSSWGALRSVPANTLYAKEYVLNPRPKTASISFKYTQLIQSNFDFGAFFANVAAGVYAKITGMWQEALKLAVENTALVPAALNYTFNSGNWVNAANKVSALNRAGLNELIGVGSLLALSKILPDHANGSANTGIDAALSVLLGDKYVNAGYLAKFMGVKLMPMMDAVVPGTQNGEISTILDPATVYIMATNGRKPMTIGINKEAPLVLEFNPDTTSDLTMGMSITMAIDAVATFTSKCAVITI